MSDQSYYGSLKEVEVTFTMTDHVLSEWLQREFERQKDKYHRETDKLLVHFKGLALKELDDIKQLMKATSDHIVIVDKQLKQLKLKLIQNGIIEIGDVEKLQLKVDKKKKDE